MKSNKPNCPRCSKPMENTGEGLWKCSCGKLHYAEHEGARLRRRRDAGRANDRRTRGK